MARRIGGRLDTGLNLLAVFLCETYGVTLTTAANAALLISLCVALTPLVEWALLGQPPTLRVWQAAGLSVIGAGLLSATSGIGRPGLGDALVLLAALLRAVMVTQTRRLAARHALPALTLTAVQSGVVTVGLAALVWVWRGPHWPSIPPAGQFLGRDGVSGVAVHRICFLCAELCGVAHEPQPGLVVDG
jgi:EamA-like transporter family.